MAWKYVQYNGETGKRRTVNGGSGGASELNDLSDVSLSSPSDGQIMQYDGVNSVWKNVNMSMHNYSTTEQVIGTWTDGKPLYERCFYVNTYPNQLASNWLQQYNVKSIKFGYIHPWDGSVEQISHDFTFHTTNKTWTSSCNKWTDFIYLQYTKSTD